MVPRFFMVRVGHRAACSPMPLLAPDCKSGCNVPPVENFKKPGDAADIMALIAVYPVFLGKIRQS